MRIARRARIAMIVALASSAVLPTAGCVPLFPVSPNEMPFQLSVSDGDVWIRWCGETGLSVGFLRTYYRADGDTSHTALRARGDIVLDVGEPFSGSAPPRDAQVIDASPIPASDQKITVFVSTGASPTDLDGPNGSFSVDSLKAMDGMGWIDTHGQPAQTSCYTEPAD